MKGADILVQMLVGYGVDTVFGVPGDTNASFYEALQREKEKITHFMARDERSAEYMADAYGRFTKILAYSSAHRGLARCILCRLLLNQTPPPWR